MIPRQIEGINKAIDTAVDGLYNLTEAEIKAAMEKQKMNSDIIAIKDSILSIVGNECEKIILFGSYAYGTPHKDSDYDFYVVLKDSAENQILVMQKIYEHMCDTNYIPVDVIANYKSRFEWRSTQPTLERTIKKRGMVIYERL